ncbi:MAG: glucose-6-phosphate dehydrogenase [Candidatus Kapaibacterium sp.]|jgi:glucose-6-phosphate 1-dehydrogenase
MRTTIIIFGAGGDLTERMLIPALYNLFRKSRLPEDTSILGFSMEDFDDEAFRKKLKVAAKKYLASEYKDADWTKFEKHLVYQRGNFQNKEDYISLEKRIGERKASPGNRIYYLATATRFFSVIVSQLGKAQMLTADAKDGYRRIIIEKPFGDNLQSAQALTTELHSIIDESQIYRIDHYLGKETVQNILVFRFENGILEPIWNRNYIEHIQITVGENIGVGHRAGYYDKAGALRDMFQNHLLQLLTLVTMEPTAILNADTLRNEKVKVLAAIREIPESQNALSTVRAQYEGYASEEGVEPDSTTETFAAIRLFIDNWRWEGVPVYLRSGKMLKEKISEIVIQFRPTPHPMRKKQSDTKPIAANRLSICIHPDEGIHLQFIAKVPDMENEVRAVAMDFHYLETFGETSMPGAYEQLLVDAMEGDATLFARNDEVDLAWKFIDKIRRGWESKTGSPLVKYPKHSWGPKEATELLQQDKHTWVLGCSQHPE